MLPRHGLLWTTLLSYGVKSDPAMTPVKTGQRPLLPSGDQGTAENPEGFQAVNLLL